MNSPDLIGRTIDGKYRLTRELGRGGMGTVYLGVHLGTERPVAVKVIAPQYMQRDEFVERFRREARAAGRLRHPNVVDVTDFGFSELSPEGRVAYLVMEYLDGCTLGEILEEERNLPVSWTLDILDQVCSAVNEAHQMGIIHRDLKPDNIWLEPNRRGGYTVKVLDFGIAKLEDHDALPASADDHGREPLHLTHNNAAATGEVVDLETLASDLTATLVSGSGNAVETAVSATQAPDDAATPLEEQRTAVFAASVEQDDVGTRISSAPRETDHASATSSLEQKSSAGLTRVGAVLGTPLYMSPEQCRGDSLDARSDIYSLGVIAYQMLSGRTPFEGDYKQVMAAHRELPPPPLVARRVRKKMSWVIATALAKDPDDRPQTALGFSDELRARGDGIFGLLRRSLVIYSEHLPKFLLITSVFQLPLIILTLLQITFSFLRVSKVFSGFWTDAAFGAVVLLSLIVGAFCAVLAVGTIVWIVVQYLAVPLRPVRLRPALGELRRHWKRLALSGITATFVPFLSAITAFIVVFLVVWGGLSLVSMAFGWETYAPIVGLIFAGVATLGAFFLAHGVTLLVTPVAMIEQTNFVQAFRRSRQLSKRAFATTVAAAMIMVLTPMLLAGTVSSVVNLAAKGIYPQSAEEAPAPEPPDGSVSFKVGDEDSEKNGIQYSLGRKSGVEVSDGKADTSNRLKHTLIESIFQIIWLPIQIIVLSFSAIIAALLYLKTRLAGGESMDDLVDRFDDENGPRKKWQQRVRRRRLQSIRPQSES